MQVEIRFGADARAEDQILGSIDARLQRTELDLLADEAGFTDPNNFPVARLAEILTTRQFPLTDWYEYEWAIYECGFEAVARYSTPMQAFLAFTYIYCNKRKQWGITIESDYYYLLIEAALLEQPEEGRLWLTDLSLRFIEWLNDHVSADQGYDRYYSLLAWLMLRRIRGQKSDSMFVAVVDALARGGYTTERLSMLTVSERDAATWLSLYRRLPGTLDPVTDTTITKLISGGAP